MEISVLINSVLKLVENKNFQKGAACFVFAILFFVLGRVTAEDCVKETVCIDYIKDGKKLSGQLTKAREECFTQKTQALKDLSEELELKCVQRISDAIDHCEFSPEIHCPICVARGECK